MDVTVLEHSSSIAKDKINGSCYEAVHIKLSIGVDIESVLVC